MMKEWIKKNITLKGIAWVMVLLSSAKFINNMAELARSASEKVVVPLGQVLTEYDNRKKAFTNMLAVATFPGVGCYNNYQDNIPNKDKKSENNIENTDQKSDSILESFKKKIGWM